MPEAQAEGASPQAAPLPQAQAQAQRAPLAAAPGVPPQAPQPAAQPQLCKDGPEKPASGANSTGTDNSVGSGAENEDSTGKRAGSTTAEKGANGADSLESLEQEKQLAWKKEKRRKQNREAQRRRRDRLMNQHRQKQAELDGAAGGDLQGIGGHILTGQPAYMMMAGGGVGGRDLLAANMQAGGKDDHFGGLNMAARYAGDLEAGAQLQSNMSMLQKQLSFGAGGMHAWANYNAAAAMHGNMLGQGLQAYGQMQQHANQGQHMQLGQQAHGQAHASHEQAAAGLHYPHARNPDSFNIGSSLNHLAMQGGNLHAGFPWDATNANLLEMRGTTMAQLGKQASFGAASRSLGALGVHGSLSMGGFGASNPFAMAGNHAALGQNGISAAANLTSHNASLTSQNSFSMGMGYEVNPLLKSGSFAPPDFSAFLRADSRNSQQVPGLGEMAKQVSFSKGAPGGGALAAIAGLDPAGLYGPMNGSEVIGRGGGEEGHQSNHSLGALPTSTGFLGGTGHGGAFQLPNGLTRQDSFGMSLAGGAMHGGMHPMLRQDSFARLNANLAFSGGPVGSPGNAIGNAALAEQSLASTGKAHALEASVSSVFGGSGANGELGISAGLGSTPPFGQESASQLSNTSQLSHNSQLSNNLASHVMGERGAESGLWRAMNQALRQDSSAGLSIGGGAIGFQQQRHESVGAFHALASMGGSASNLAALHQFNPATDLTRLGSSTSLDLSRGSASNVSPVRLDIGRTNSAGHDSLHGDHQGQGSALGTSEGSAAPTVAATGTGRGVHAAPASAGGGGGGTGGGGGDSGTGGGGDGGSRPAIQSDARI